MQVVIFKLNDEQFAVETAKVQGINDMMEITKVPNSPEYIKGLVNLRGTIISVLDINLLLDVEKSKKNQDNVIILNMDEESVGITVDEVNEVLDVEENVIEKLEYKNKPYIRGIINFQNRIITLIDISRLITN